VRGLTDDPYRSLAGAVREAKAFDKSNKPFAEFLWANFFRGLGPDGTRQRPPIHIGPGAEGFRRAVEEGKLWAHLPQASHLPGYKKN
jgi:hypothetical protein